jgi:DNA polymerase IV (DinB-like DNA polymerase)
VIQKAVSELLQPFLNGTDVRLVGIRLSNLEGGGRTRQASIEEFCA